MKFKILALLIPLLLMLSACGSSVETVTIAEDKTSDTNAEVPTREEVENMIENAVAKSASEIAGNIDSSISEGIAARLDAESIKREIKQQVLSELSEVIKQEVSDYEKANKEKQVDTDELTKNIISSVNGMIDEKIAGLQLVQNVTYNTTEEVTKVIKETESPNNVVDGVTDGQVIPLSHELPARYEQENGAVIVLDKFEARVYNNDRGSVSSNSPGFKYRIVATYSGYVENIASTENMTVFFATGIGDTSSTSASVQGDLSFSGEKTWEWETYPNSYSVGSGALHIK